MLPKTGYWHTNTNLLVLNILKPKQMIRQSAVILLSSLLIACSGDSIVEEALIDNEPVVSGLTIERAEKVQEVFYTIPSPMETANLFYITGAEYKTEATNSIKNINNYVTSGQKALNLGVYGADVSYANIFDQSEQSMLYINCTKKMTDALDISSAFDVATIERVEENMNNRDSLMVIIDDAFWIIDAHLKGNGQDHLSALIMTGGWIEGLYLGTQSLDRENPDAELMKRVAAQKSSLASLMDLLITYDNAEVMAVKQNMKVLQTAYAKVDEKAIDPVIIFKITDAVSKVRAQIIR